METKPSPQPPDDKKMPTWPLVVNLLLLLFCAVKGGLSSLIFAVPTLLVLNAVAAGIIYFSGGKMAYGKALFLAIVLSVLLLLLIGLGMCALQPNR